MNIVVIAFYNRDQNISAILLMHFSSPLLSAMSRLHIGGKRLTVIHVCTNTPISVKCMCCTIYIYIYISLYILLSICSSCRLQVVNLEVTTLHVCYWVRVPLGSNSVAGPVVYLTMLSLWHWVALGIQWADTTYHSLGVQQMNMEIG